LNNNINKQTELANLGLIDYKEAWDLQEKLLAATIQIKLENRTRPRAQQAPTPNHLIFCEHPHVYTLGKTGNPSNLLLGDEGLKEADAAFYKINRGGDITYHGPGQLVCYPIIDLENFFTDIHKFLRLLEEVVIKTCETFDVPAGRIDGLTGVWVDFDKSLQKPWDPGKICAIGVKTSRWVTMHGLALNVNTDLNYFGNIVPCGIQDKRVTSLSQEADRIIDMHEVRETLILHFGDLFEMTMEAPANN